MWWVGCVLVKAGGLHEAVLLGRTSHGLLGELRISHAICGRYCAAVITVLRCVLLCYMLCVLHGMHAANCCSVCSACCVCFAT